MPVGNRHHSVTEVKVKYKGLIGHVPLPGYIAKGGVRQDSFSVTVKLARAMLYSDTDWTPWVFLLWSGQRKEFVYISFYEKCFLYDVKERDNHTVIVNVNGSPHTSLYVSLRHYHGHMVYA